MSVRGDERYEGNVLATPTRKQMHNKSLWLLPDSWFPLTPDKDHQGFYKRKKKLTHTVLIRSQQLWDKAKSHFGCFKAWEIGGCHPVVKLTGDSSVSSLSIRFLPPDAFMSFRIWDWCWRHSFILSSVRVRRSSSTETVCVERGGGGGQ